ncbi:hypothetical protein ACX3YC_13610 [Pseudomonas mohnii]
MNKHSNEAVEGDDGGLVICRGCKARGTYAEPPSGECPTPYKSDRVLLAESMAREQALQQRLNAADQLIDDFSKACEWTQEEDSGIWNSSCGSTWSFNDDGPTENGMNFCHCCGMRLIVRDAVVESEPIDDWQMNPCKQGHRDVGADGGVAHCYTCDEKIEAATTQEAFERWNATHPQQ